MRGLTAMKALRVIASLLSVFVTLPIWYWLMYRILVAINASELMWFLYWIYLPVALLSSTILKLTEGKP